MARLCESPHVLDKLISYKLYESWVQIINLKEKKTSIVYTQYCYPSTKGLMTSDSNCDLENNYNHPKRNSTKYVFQRTKTSLRRDFWSIPLVIPLHVTKPAHPVSVIQVVVIIIMV